MTISYPLTPPTTPCPSRVEWYMNNAVGMGQSPFSLKQQIVAWGGDLWHVAVTMPYMDRSEAAAWFAFFGKLRSREGTFLFHDTLLASPRGTALGDPKVNGASQTGYSLVTDGWTAGATLKAGDLFNIGTGGSSRLYMNLSDVTASGGGAATLDVWPSLRGQADNTDLDLSSPNCVMRLNDTLIMPIAADETQLWSIAFTALEAR